MVPLHPSFSEFEAMAGKGNLIPVYTELTADYLTPISAFEKLVSEGQDAFLLESAEKSDQIGRYSFLGRDPRWVFVARGREIEIRRKEGEERFAADEESEPLAELEKLMAGFKPVPVAGLPAFYGGAVGYLAYEMVRFFEPAVPAHEQDDLEAPDMIFMGTESLVVFDHRFRRLLVVANVVLDDHADLKAAYAWAENCIGGLIDELKRPLDTIPLASFQESGEEPLESNTTRAEYEGMVEAAKEFIRAGDIFQVVPSQRFRVPYPGRALDLYRALRHINPSPYMFCLQFAGHFALAGSSPEVHVRSIDGKVEIRPIAGTRWRGETEEEDQALAEDLLGDPKERAEHIMLVDLARNDVGRIAAFDSVKVTDFMTIERYSHVMHIVSNVEGQLKKGCSAYDVMRATFPAGTVSGSPKVRAMQIIRDLEKSRRGAYSGAVGYFGFDGNHDSCIALRTAVVKDGAAYVQAGAGVVADSVPASEYEETVNKAKGLIRAVQHARWLGEHRDEPAQPREA